MSRHLGLRTRIKRLERQGRSRRPRRAVIYARYDEAEDSMVGLAAISGAATSRLWGEALPALCERARAGLGARQVLIARYPAPAPVIAPVAAPGEPVPPSAPAFDPKRPDAWRDYRAFAEQGQMP